MNTNKKLLSFVKLLLIIAVISRPAISSTKIEELHSYEDFPWAELGGPNTSKKIFIWDIDGTLMNTNGMTTFYTAVWNQPVESAKKIWSLCTGGGTRGVLDLGTRYESSSLIDNKLPENIRALIANGHISWNYTNVYTGDLYDTTYEAQIVAKLDTLHIPRSSILVDGEEVERVELAEYEGGHPSFYKGALFNDKKAKAGVFAHSFLPWLQANSSYKDIKSLVYTDDIAKHVRDIGKACKEVGIDYHGIICCFD